jgi:transposase, IS5 family
VSLADPDARPIRKGKARPAYRVRDNLLVAEDELGFIADHQLHRGNPADAPQLVHAVERSSRSPAGHPPPGRRPRVRHGFGTAANDQPVAALASDASSCSAPAPGQGRLAFERTPSVPAAARNWRAGIKAHISHPMRAWADAHVAASAG